MTNPLHDAAMAAKRFHDAALAALDTGLYTDRAKAGMARAQLLDALRRLERGGDLDCMSELAEALCPESLK